MYNTVDGMRFVATVALLAGTLPMAANGQERVDPRVHVDVSAGLALPIAADIFRDYYTVGPDLVVGVRYRLSHLLDWRMDAGAILFGENLPESLSGGDWSEFSVAPVLSVFTGPRLALSSAPTHMYLHGSVGILTGDHELLEESYSPAFGFGVGVRQSRFFEELTYTHVVGPYEGYGYLSLRFGIAPGRR